MRDRYIIIDDFYDNPDELVKVALSSMNEEDSPTGNKILFPWVANKEAV